MHCLARHLDGPVPVTMALGMILLCVASQEPVHKLAWTLDACLKDRVLDDRRLRELSHFMHTFDRESAAPAAKSARCCITPPPLSIAGRCHAGHAGPQSCTHQLPACI